MRTACIRDGVVENIIIAGPGYELEGYTLVPVDGRHVNVGDLFDGTNFTSAPLPPEPVPVSVTPLQMRKAIRSSGLKPAVDAYIASLGDSEAVEEWEYALTIERNNPLLENAAALLGMTDAQVDDLFRLAATLT